MAWPRSLGCAVAVCLAGLLAAVGLIPASAQTLQAVPSLTSHVIDTTGTLRPEQQQGIDQKLQNFEASVGAQIVVLMVASTAPEDIAAYANRVASAWGVGRKNIGDGVVLVVAKDDRALRIEVARALEGALPDLMAKRIIDHAMAPRFHEGDFAAGLDAGTDQIMALIRGEALPPPGPANSGTTGFQWMDLAIFLFFAVTVGGTIARRALGTRAGSALTGMLAGGLAFMVTQSALLALGAAIAAFVLTLLTSLNKYNPTSTLGSGPGGGFGSGGGSRPGGGFSSGGGGSFGGGGASGGW